MRTRSISELVAEHNVVVFDTSILDPSCATTERRRIYRDSLFAASRSEGLATVKDVYNEAHARFSNNYQFLDMVRKKCISLEPMQQEYLKIFKYVLPQAKKKGMHLNRDGTEKAFPNTDAKLASLALLVSTEVDDVAFISGDRALNDLVYDQTVDKNLPVAVKPISIYYFWQPEITFSPYSLAFRRATYGSSRRAVS